MKLQTGDFQEKTWFFLGSVRHRFNPYLSPLQTETSFRRGSKGLHTWFLLRFSKLRKGHQQTPIKTYGTLHNLWEHGAVRTNNSLKSVKFLARKLPRITSLLAPQKVFSWPKTNPYFEPRKAMERDQFILGGLISN